MSLLNRKLPPLGRVARQERDDRIVVVATEDTYAPEQYFNGLHFDRVRVLVLPTQDNKSSPEHVVDRLCKAFSNARLLKEDQDDDAFWVLIDTDHHFQRNHCGGTVQALDEARRRGFGIAVSNPCFEVWLLLHQEPLGVGDAFANAKAVEDRLRAVLGRYDKTHLDMRQFSLPQLKPLAKPPQSPEASKM